MRFLPLFIILCIKFAVSDEVEEVKQILEEKLKNPDIGATIESLVDEYEFSEQAVVGSYRRCLEEQVGDQGLMACFIAGLYREKIIEDHKLMLCASEYFTQTSLDCLLGCFDNYTPECIKCVGEHLPGLLDCILGLPYEFQ